METKECTKCKTEQPLTEFGRNSSRPDGIHYWCRGCLSVQAKKYRAAKGEKLRQHSREYHADNRGRLNQRSREYGKKNRRAIRNRTLQREHGIDLETYEALLEFQGGGCAICGKKENPRNKSLAVDHCHETGEVRGILCDSCNTSLGKLGDNPEGIQKAIRYLEVSSD